MVILMVSIEKDLGQADHLYLNLCKMEKKLLKKKQNKTKQKQDKMAFCNK